MSDSKQQSVMNSIVPTKHHQLIYDPDQIREFYRDHMAQFVKQSDLVFLSILMARRKYFPALTTGATIFPRKIYDLNDGGAEDFIRFIQHYEVAEGLYRDHRNSEIIIPTEGLALYMTCNPLSQSHATNKTLASTLEQQQFHLIQLQQQVNKLNEIINSGGKNDPLTKQIHGVKLISKFKSELHSSPIKLFKKLDVDTKDTDKIILLKQFMLQHEIKTHLIIESKNGFHVFLKFANLLGNSSEIGLEGKAHQALYQFVKKHSVNDKQIDWISIENHGMLVIPGTLQGGFPVRIVKWD